MGPLFIFVAIGLAMVLIIVSWTMVLRFQRERKISDLKIAYLRLAQEEQNAYQRYIQAEKNLQEIEIDVQKSKDIIKELKNKIAGRKKELREMIESLRLIRSKIGLVSDSSAKLDLALENTKLTSEIKTRLLFNNEDKTRIIFEKNKIKEKTTDIPFLAKDSEDLGQAWETLRHQLDRLEADFRALDQQIFKNFSEAYVKKRTADSRLDPEREIVNMILLLNNKKGMLYVRKKEMAKDPTTESSNLIKRYEADIQKLEAQLVAKSKGMGISPKRLNDLKNLFQK